MIITVAYTGMRWSEIIGLGPECLLDNQVDVSWKLYELNGRVISHMAGSGRCEGSGQPPAGDLTLASWLPVLPSLTPHGLRHGHQTWMDEDRIADVLKSERMGHEVPGMRGVYSHVSDAMRAELKSALQERWTASLRERARLAPGSIVPVLDALLTEQGGSLNKIGSQIAPKIGHETAPLRPRSRK